MKKAKSNRSNSSKRKIASKPRQLTWYARFLPAAVLTVFATFLWAQPQFALIQKNHDVLAYATNVSPAGLLGSTNSERAANGVHGLTLSSQLNSAAQAKANDMVNRNYWSHQTPDGQQPWIFITNAGYQYLSAGENLAYGFATSASTVTGWMNSPPHKSNLLGSNFTEVGFGIANSANFVGNGQQTVVVAMYAKPQSSTPAPAAPQPAAKQQATKPQATASKEPETPAPQPEKATEEPEKTEDKPKEEPIAVTTIENNGGSSEPTASTTEVRRIQILTGGNAIWSATFVILFVCSTGLLWLIHRGFRFGQWLKASEKFIGRHIHLDLTVLAVVYLGFVLLATNGTIL